VEHRLGVIQLDQTLAALQAWREAHAPQTGEPLDTLSRWRLQFLAASAAEVLTGDLLLLSDFPPPEAGVAAYVEAVDQALAALGERQAIVQRQATELVGQREALLAQWEVETQAAHNLTANLTVEPLAVDDLRAQPVRFTSQMALVGGILGVLAWGMIWLARPLRKAGK
jgi:hypothetical protein